MIILNDLKVYVKFKYIIIANRAFNFFMLSFHVKRELSTVIACIMHEKDEFNSIINYFHSNYVETGLYHKRRVHYTY